MDKNTPPEEWNSSSPESKTLPALSVVVIAPGGTETVHKTVRHLAMQQSPERIELLLLHREHYPFDTLNLSTDAFFGCRAVSFASNDSRAAVKAKCLSFVKAPYVAFLEDHAYPHPEWSKALLQAHADGWTAVGFNVDNANPDKLLSWVNLFITYGPYVRIQSGETSMLSAENISYRKEALLALKDSLETLFEHEYFLHQRLVQQGGTLFQESRATIYHRNKETLLSTATENYWVGRNFARSRAHDWGLGRRLIYAAGSPLLPLIKGRRIVKQIQNAGLERLLPWLLPGLIYALSINAISEMLAYLFGSSMRASQR